MKLTIALIDSVLIRKGSKTLSEMEAYSKAPRKANEELLMRILRENKDTEYGSTASETFIPWRNSGRRSRFRTTINMNRTFDAWCRTRRRI